MFDQPAILRFSTSELPEGERVAAFREVFGRAATNLDITPVDGNVRADGLLRGLPGPA